MRRIATFVGMITLVFWSAAALTADADFSTLPNAMKGRWNYDNRYSNIWSVVIDRINTDGTFDGKITFYGINCYGGNTPIVNGRMKLGEMTFSADFGFRCTNVAFVLRKGKDHLLEGELKTDAGPLTSTVWLDADK